MLHLKRTCDRERLTSSPAVPFVGVGAIIAIALDGPAIKRQMNWAVDDPVSGASFLGFKIMS